MDGITLQFGQAEGVLGSRLAGLEDFISFIPLALNADWDGNIPAVGYPSNYALTGADTIVGSPGNDTLTGADEPFSIYAQDFKFFQFENEGGEETFILGQGGSDVVDGLSGDDTVLFSDADGAVVIDLSLEKAWVGLGHRDLAMNRVETVRNGGASENEEQNLWNNAYDGFFTITFDTETTDPIAYDATETELESALESLPNIGTGNVVVIGSGTKDDPWHIEFTGSLANSDVTELTTRDFFQRTGGSRVTTKEDGVEGGTFNEVQTLYNNAEEGFFTITFEGETTGPIVYNSQVIETSLESLSNIDDVEVSGAGTEDNPWVIEFTGTLANKPVNELTTQDFFQRTSGSTITTQRDGVAGTYNEEQTLYDNAEEGFFTVTFDDETTGPIIFNATHAVLESALEGLGNIDDVSVTGSGIKDNPWVIEFTGTLANSDVTEISTTDFFHPRLSSRIDPAKERQEISHDGEGGQFRLIFNETETGDIDFDASAAEVQERLNAIGVDADVTVTGEDGGPWTVIFNTLGNKSELAVGTSSLTNATAGVVVETSNGDNWQKLYNRAQEGSFTITFDGETTDLIAYNIPATDPVGNDNNALDDLEDILESLSNIDDVEVTGAGRAGDPWVITFLDPSPGNDSVPAIT
ncbi:hypothetical protein ACFL7M_19350, partial [Thermodesulfobacteriota bacterium]